VATVQQEGSRNTREIWVRGLFMLSFLIALGVAQVVLNFAAIVQFLWLLIAREPNEFLLHFGSSLAKWVADAVRFLTGASEEKPFPWKEWPAAD
jgi:hypothetical protein